MFKKITTYRIEWEKNSDASLPRIFDWDDTVKDEQEMIMLLEAHGKDKVRKIYPYQPKPQYLILYAEIYSGNNGYNHRLILHISPTRKVKMYDSLFQIKCFQKRVESEIIFDVVRTTCHQKAEVNSGNSLCFEEFQRNSKGDYISILQIIGGIYQTVSNCTSNDQSTDDQWQLLIDAWED